VKNNERRETNKASEGAPPFGRRVSSLRVDVTLETRHRIFHGLLQKFPVTRSALVAVTVVNSASRQTWTCLASSCTPPDLVTPLHRTYAFARCERTVFSSWRKHGIFIVTRIASSGPVTNKNSNERDKAYVVLWRIIPGGY